MKTGMFVILFFSLSLAAQAKTGMATPSKKLPKTVKLLVIKEEPALSPIEVKAITVPHPRKIQVQAFEKVKKPNNIKTSALARVLAVHLRAPQVLPAPYLYQAYPDPKMSIDQDSELQVEPFSQDERDFLVALIMLDFQKNEKLAAGLLAELLKSKENKVRFNALYRFAYVMLSLGFYLEFKEQMSKLATEGSQDWQKKALLALAKEIQVDDLDIISFMIKKSENLEFNRMDQFALNKGKYYFALGDLSRAFSAADQIEEGAELYPDALVFKSMILYRSSQVKEAIQLQEKALALLEKNKPQSEIKSISALTLARYYFQQGQWKAAFNNYLKVHKSHPEWPQAMIEQAWAQILFHDYEGAAGNMFTLHTDFFKSRFAPESYVVRTVGYLNLCQYGDGAKVLFELQKKYTLVQKIMSEFKEQKKEALFFYETVKSAFKNSDEQVVRGLPKSMVFELARQPEFMTYQSRINQVESEMQKIEVLISDLNRFKHALAARAEMALKNLRPLSLTRLQNEKAKDKTLAEKVLQQKLEKMNRLLAKTLEQAEVLKYELYSGAGEHLRQQMAGGAVNPKEREELKVADGKSMKWDFRGEVWEDELGHFRSSLKNVCADHSKKQEVL